MNHAEVSSNHDAIRHCFDQVLSISPLERVRQQRVLFVPGGPEGFDRLFLDLFDHSHRVEETSLFLKPSIITYPDRLLDRLGASLQDRKRKEIIFQGFKSRRCFFTEILRRETLKELVDFGHGGVSRIYGPGITEAMAEEHIQAIIHQIEAYFPVYKLVLTDAAFPFLLSTFQIFAEDEPESYVVFFKQLIIEHDPIIECFAIQDQAVTRNVLENVINWVIAHPSSESDPTKVVAELRVIAKPLRAKGRT